MRWGWVSVVRVIIHPSYPYLSPTLTYRQLSGYTLATPTAEQVGALNSLMTSRRFRQLQRKRGTGTCPGCWRFPSFIGACRRLQELAARFSLCSVKEHLCGDSGRKRSGQQLRFAQSGAGFDSSSGTFSDAHRNPSRDP